MCRTAWGRAPPLGPFAQVSLVVLRKLRVAKDIAIAKLQEVAQQSPTVAVTMLTRCPLGPRPRVLEPSCRASVWNRRLCSEPCAARDGAVQCPSGTQSAGVCIHITNRAPQWARGRGRGAGGGGWGVGGPKRTGTPTGEYGCEGAGRWQNDQQVTPKARSRGQRLVAPPRY